MFLKKCYDRKLQDYQIKCSDYDIILTNVPIEWHEICYCPKSYFSLSKICEQGIQMLFHCEEIYIMGFVSWMFCLLLFNLCIECFYFTCLLQLNSPFHMQSADHSLGLVPCELPQTGFHNVISNIFTVDSSLRSMALVRERLFFLRLSQLFLKSIHTVVKALRRKKVAFMTILNDPLMTPDTVWLLIITSLKVNHCCRA